MRISQPHGFAENGTFSLGAGSSGIDLAHQPFTVTVDGFSLPIPGGSFRQVGAQYYNARSGRTGHLRQNRFFACTLGPDHLWAALAYVERNPVRASMVPRDGAYPWSSAAAHLTGADEYGIPDLEWWQREGRTNWVAHLEIEDQQRVEILRACTHAGRPFGDERFVKEMGDRFGRQWAGGRPGRAPATDGNERADHSTDNAKLQFTLF